MKEIWKDVGGYKQVSNLGRVKRLRHEAKNVAISWGWKKTVGTKIIPKTINRGTLTPDGYYRTTVSGKNCAIHRLIGKQFIPNPENKPFINHKNGIRSDNRVVNLEWCTASENNYDSAKRKRNKIGRFA